MLTLKQLSINFWNVGGLIFLDAGVYVQNLMAFSNAKYITVLINTKV